MNVHLKEVYMGNLILDIKIMNTITSLSEQLKTSKEEIVKKAIHSYAKKINQKNHLMKFAGILKEEEASEVLKNK